MLDYYNPFEPNINIVCQIPKTLVVVLEISSIENHMLLSYIHIFTFTLEKSYSPPQNPKHRQQQNNDPACMESIKDQDAIFCLAPILGHFKS